MVTLVLVLTKKFMLYFLSESEDLNVLQTKTKQLLLLARIRERAGNLVSSLATLKEARDNQYRLQKRTSIEQSGGSQEQNTILARLVMTNF